MRMRQSLAQLEREFEEQRSSSATAASTFAVRRSSAPASAGARKIERGQKLRFMLLMLSIALTVVIVTVAMFETLAWLMG